MWRDRYGDAGDWVFVFAGDFDIDELVDLAASYIGTLPGDGTVEQWVDVEDPPPAGVVRHRPGRHRRLVLAVAVVHHSPSTRSTARCGPTTTSSPR